MEVPVATCPQGTCHPHVSLAPWAVREGASEVEPEKAARKRDTSGSLRLLGCRVLEMAVRAGLQSV